jgi:hypothetical protein
MTDLPSQGIAALSPGLGSRDPSGRQDWFSPALGRRVKNQTLAPVTSGSSDAMEVRLKNHTFAPGGIGQKSRRRRSGREVESEKSDAYQVATERKSLLTEGLRL